MWKWGQSDMINKQKKGGKWANGEGREIAPKTEQVGKIAKVQESTGF